MMRKLNEIESCTGWLNFDVLANKGGTYLYIYIYIWIELANVFPKVCRQALVFPSLATDLDLHLNGLHEQTEIAT